MSALPAYVEMMVLTGVVGTTATTCVVLSRGAIAVGLSRRTAAGLAVLAGLGWGAWVVVSALLAHADVYRFDPARPLPWLPVAMIVALAAPLLAARVPAVAKILAHPDALRWLMVPQRFRVVGASFLVVMALGQLPAVFAVPAGLGDIAIGLEAAFLVRRGVGARGAMWFNVLGLLDLVVALGICYTAAPGAARLLIVSPSTVSISLLPLALIPTTIVPLAAALHLLSLQKLTAAAPTETAPVRSRA